MTVTDMLHMMALCSIAAVVLVYWYSDKKKWVNLLEHADFQWANNFFITLVIYLLGESQI